MTCRKCGRDIEEGDFLPYRHLEPKGAGHYASPVRSSVERPALVPVPHAGMGEPGAQQTTRQGRLPDIQEGERAG